MPLKALVKDINEVPEPLRSSYVKADDGSFVLDVDDSAIKGKVDEFRTSNRKLQSQVEQIQQQLDKYKGVDPEKYSQALEALGHLEKMEDADLLKAGKFDEVLKERQGTMSAEFEKKITQREKALQETQQKYGDLSGRYKTLRIDTEVNKVINEIGVPRPGALTDILSRARQVADIADDDSVVLKEVYNEKSEPMGLKEWGQRLLRDAPHLFEPGQGGGAAGARTVTNSSGVKMIPRSQRHKFLKEVAEGKLVVDPNS